MSRVTHRVLDVEVYTGGQQRLDQLEVSGSAGQHEGRVSILYDADGCEQMWEG